MISRLRRWLSDPLVLLCLAAGLLAFVVQSGELGTADTMHRLADHALALDFRAAGFSRTSIPSSVCTAAEAVFTAGMALASRC